MHPLTRFLPTRRIRSPKTVQDILHLLEMLNTELAADNTRAEVYLVGGAVMCLALDARAATRDLNAWFKPAAAVRLAAARVAAEARVPADWLNAGPADLLHFGLPEGFDERLTRRWFGPAPTVHFASRLDQIHFKLYAMVDQGPGRHEADLRALAPTVEELHAAALWTRTHDPSLGFRSELILALRHLGVEDVDVDD